MSETNYYPALSDLINADELPEILSFVKDGIKAVFEDVYYKDLRFSKNIKGDSAFYSLDLVSTKRLDLELLGTGMFLVLNTDHTTGKISSFPLTVFWDWKILSHLRGFDFSTFSFSVEDIFALLMEILDVSETQVLDITIRTFASTPDELISIDENSGTEIGDATLDFPSSIEQFVAEVNTLYGTELTAPESSDNELEELAAALWSLGDSPHTVVLKVYILKVLPDLPENQTKDRLNDFLSAFIPNHIDEYLEDILIPKIRATLSLSAGIEFPRSMLVPVYDREGNNPFATALPEGESEAVTQTGEPLSVIPEQDEKGNPKVMLSFGQALVYADTEKGVGFEADAVFSMNVPAQIGNTGLIIEIKELKVDLSSKTNFEEADLDGRPAEFTGVCITQAAIYLPKSWFKDPQPGAIPQATSAEIYGEQLLIGTGGFSGKIGLKAIGETNQEAPVFWTSLGSESGFLIGFERFDLQFKQNKVTSSDISGALEIKKFKYPKGTVDENGEDRSQETVKIGIQGHIHDDGSFNLTASAKPPYPINFEDVFTYHISSLELGKEQDEFYLGTSGSLEFQGFLKNTLNLKNIEVDRLRIYSDGSIEFEGGTIALTEPVVLPLGPVELTVTAMNYGSHQAKDQHGTMRNFNYFGFDGGISIDPLGIEVRGDGVKYYYCTDDLPDKPESYLHIQTLYIDLTIPASSPSVILNGWISIPEPGISEEYAGSIKLELPQAKLAGSASIKLAPRYPAFIVDADMQLPVPIPLGGISMYGFSGLIGYRYVAEKEAIGLKSGENTWFEYYKAPERGVQVKKFSGPAQTKKYSMPFSLGAGASLGTAFDDGTALNIKAMVLLSIPSLFMIDGKAAVLSKRLGLTDEKSEPPFFAFLALGDNSLEFGFGADFKLPTDTGDIVKVLAEIQAGFFFKDASKWYINIGTKTTPTTALILRFITIKSYLMLSAKGIEAGAKGEIDFKRTYGPIRVHAWAYVEIGGQISFQSTQFGASMAAGVGADIDIKIFSLYASFDALFSVEAPKPFLIKAKFRLCVRISIFWVFSFKFCGDLAIAWEFNSDVDTAPIDPLIGTELGEKVADLVKGVNMLSNETFDLAYFAQMPEGLDAKILKAIIPMDTYIDIKTQKGLYPNEENVQSKIAGMASSFSGATDLIPPLASVDGNPIRQVTHQYSIEQISIKSWQPPIGNQAKGQWLDYDPYQALYPNKQFEKTYPIGHFQLLNGTQHNVIRLLATSPFTITEQLGNFNPAENGITPSVLFCQPETWKSVCVNFLEKEIGTRYYCKDSNQLFFSDQVAFFLLNKEEGDYAEISNEQNTYGFAQSLSFKNRNKLQIRLPQPAVEVSLKLTAYSQGVKISYYAPSLNVASSEVQFRNPNPEAIDPEKPYVETYSFSQLSASITYKHPDWMAISRIEIESVIADQDEIDALREEIAEMEYANNLIALGFGNGKGELQSTKGLEEKLKTLEELGCSFAQTEKPCEKDEKTCALYEEILEIKKKHLVEPAAFNTRNITTYQKSITKIHGLILLYLAGKKHESLDKQLEILDKYQHKPPVRTEQKGFFAFLLDLLYKLINWLFSRNTSAAANDPTKQNKEAYTAVLRALNLILSSLYESGNCGCSEQAEPTLKKCETLLHSVCWLSLEKHLENHRFRGREAIAESTDLTLNALDEIQPIWRPDTSYLVHFVLKDLVNNQAPESAKQYAHTYGFTTGRSIGLFHLHPNTNYVDKDHPEKFAQFQLTSLTRYIDYDRSYPSPDGNLLSAKPLFYNDQTTRIYLFFTKAYTTYFFHQWEQYNGKVKIDDRIKIVIKDPRETDPAINPPSLEYDENDTQYLHIPQTIESWKEDEDPLVPRIFSQYENLLNSNECVLLGGNTIIPPSNYLQVQLKQLKPVKLYTAVINNVYKKELETEDAGQDAEQLAEIHRFTFQTSRYANFTEQVMSYMLSDPDKTTSRAAVFPIELRLSNDQLNAAFATIKGDSNEISEELESKYPHKFDRILEGILALPPMDTAISTEFNVIRNVNDANKICALLIRNPEPFNNPRMPVEILQGTLQVLKGNLEEADTSFVKLFSKDGTQILLMKQNQQRIPEVVAITGPLHVQFTYKIWNGSNYIVPGTTAETSLSVGRVVVQNLDLDII